MNKYSRKQGRFDLVFVAKKALKTTALSDKILYGKVVTKQQQIGNETVKVNFLQIAYKFAG